MSVEVNIKLKGCDDSTRVTMTLSQMEMALLQDVAEEVLKAAGEDCCKPKLRVWLVGESEPTGAINMPDGAA